MSYSPPPWMCLSWEHWFISEDKSSVDGQHGTQCPPLVYSTANQNIHVCNNRAYRHAISMHLLLSFHAPLTTSVILQVAAPSQSEVVVWQAQIWWCPLVWVSVLHCFSSCTELNKWHWRPRTIFDDNLNNLITLSQKHCYIFCVESIVVNKKSSSGIHLDKFL